MNYGFILDIILYILLELGLQGQIALRATDTSGRSRQSSKGLAMTMSVSKKSARRRVLHRWTSRVYLLTELDLAGRFVYKH